MPQNKKGEYQQIEKKQRNQQAMLDNINRKERILKWAAIGLLILLLLLFLFIGYATDWMKGLSKDSSIGSATTPIQGSLDSAGSGAQQIQTPGSTGGTTTNTSTRNTGTTGTTTQTGNTSTNTSKETTTTNKETTNNNNNTTTPPANDGLLNLYANSSVGEDISKIVEDAKLLGVSQECHNEVLVQVCDFRQGERIITTKNLLGTGLLTSIVKNF